MARVGTWAVCLAVALVLGVLGCAERSLTRADCEMLTERLVAAWRADGNDAVTLAETDQFRRFVVDEGRNIAKRFSAECQAQVGRPIDERELSCLRRAESIDAVLACANP